MDQDFGKRLEKARLDRDLSIEQAAAAVRIRGTFLRALESGDLTKFPNAAYAKSFLLMYGRFLGVDLKSVAEGIDTTTQMKVEGYQYLTSRAADLPKSKPEPEPGFSMAPTPKSSTSWLPVVVLGALVAIVVAAGIVWSNLNRLDDSQNAAPVPGATQPGDSTAVQPLDQSPNSLPAPAAASAAGESAGPPEPAPQALPPPPRPVVISMPAPTPTSPAPATAAPGAEPEIPRARPISPVARIAAADSAALADLVIAKPSAPRLPGSRLPPPINQAPAGEEDESPAKEPNTIVLEPKRKTWVVIRKSAGGQKLYENYLDPTAKPMRLPAGRYFIELKDADGVEITRNGKRIAYAAPGVAIE